MKNNRRVDSLLQNKLEFDVSNKSLFFPQLIPENLKSLNTRITQHNTGYILNVLEPLIDPSLCNSNPSNHFKQVPSSPYRDRESMIPLECQ